MAFVCFTALLAQAQDAEPAVRSKIIALEKAWNQAYKAGDTQALDAILDNEIVLVNGLTMTALCRLKESSWQA